MLKIIVGAVAAFFQPEMVAPSWRALPAPVRAAIQAHLEDVVILPDGKCVDLWPVVERERVRHQSMVERDIYRVIDTGTGMRFRRKVRTDRVLADTRMTRAWKLPYEGSDEVRDMEGLPEIDGGADWRFSCRRSNDQTDQIVVYPIDDTDPVAELRYVPDVGALIRSGDHLEGNIFRIQGRRVEVPPALREACYWWRSEAGEPGHPEILVEASTLQCDRNEAVQAIAEGRLIIQTWDLETRNGATIWQRGLRVDSTVVKLIPRPLETLEGETHGSDLNDLPQPDLPGSPSPTPTIDPIDDPSPRDPLQAPT